MLLTLVLAGGGKRGRGQDPPPPKNLVVGQLRGGIEMLWNDASEPTRAECRRIDGIRDWTFLGGLTSAQLTELNLQLLDLKYNLNEVTLSKLVIGHMTNRHVELEASVRLLEREISVLHQHAVLAVTRLVMNDQGDCDWKHVRDTIRMKLEFKCGEEAALGANRIIPA